MKKTLFISIALLICFSYQSWANTSAYYGRLTARVSSSSPTGSGKVYAGKDNTAGTYSSTSTSEPNNVKTSGDSETFYAFAKAEEGYSFLGWSSSDGGAIESTDNPYAVQVSCSGTEEAPSNFDVYANFVASDATVSVTFKGSERGIYTIFSGTSSFVVSSEDVNASLLALDESQLSATPAEGYKFYGWYTLVNNKKNYLSYDLTFVTHFLGGESIYADFISVDAPLFFLNVTQKKYYDLSEAISEAGSATSKIILVEDGTISGNITIPSNVTLLIPYDDAYTLNAGKPGVSSSWTVPSVYKKLTLASGASLEVYGTICVNALQVTCSSNTDGTGPGTLTGKYGCIHMKEGSSITLKSAAELYAYGIIEGPGVAQGLKDGSGMIVAESGSNVYEGFAIGDWKGGTIASKMNGNTNKVFLFNQYFIQNIQVPLTLNYGVTETVYTSVTVTLLGNTTAGAKIIGTSDALFTLGQGAKICKWYDGLNDKLHIDTDGSVNMDHLSISVQITVDTKNYVMPLTNNISVKVNSGTVTITSGVELLPNAEIEIAKGAELAVKSGASLYIYDIDDWGLYVYQSKYTQPLKSVPNRVNSLLGHTTDKSYMKDAAIKVNGTITVNGNLYTSVTGANIYSDGGGKVVLPNSVGTSGATTYGFVSYDSDVTYGSISNTPAQLKNADESYLATAGTAAGTTYYYGKVRGYWSTEEETFAQGDVNMDGAVDVSDVTKLVAIILGSDEATEKADVNGDSSVDVSDVTALVAIILGKE
ncbi:MAG: dockerin type I repeat-containing protein [Bacteroidaceae bacterium]|nr:dockerin type I repeat-containing protein [Bacteroidaceae bacterium]